MHTTAFAEIGMNCVYTACKVENNQLKEATDGIRGLNILGANVTIPHKVEIMKYLDEIDPIAEDIGAINTIVNRDGHLFATNTDGSGAMRSLKEGKINLNGKVVMVGAGGVARPIAFHLLKEIKHLYITDINNKAAITLETALKKRYGDKITVFKSNTDDLKEVIENANFLVNCTPVGMYPKVDNSPVPKSMLREDLNVFDVVYNPLKTKLIKEAEAVGAKAIGGIKMFLYQGVEAFELWTGKKAPTEIMEKIIIEELTLKK